MSVPISMGTPSAARIIVPNPPEPPSPTGACIVGANGSLPAGTAVGVGVGTIAGATVVSPFGTGTAVGTEVGTGVGG